MTLTELFTNIANAIRSKKGTTDKIRPVNFASEIEAFECEENVVVDSNLVKNGTAISSAIIKISNLDLEGKTDYNSLCSNMKYLQAFPFIKNSVLVTSMSGICSACQNMSDYTNLENMDTSQVQNFNSAFYQNYQAKAPAIDTSGGVTFNNMFHYSKFQEMPEYDFGSAQSFSKVLDNCGDLRICGGFKNLGKNFTTTSENAYVFSLVYCSNLTLESAINILNKLYDLNLTYNVANDGVLYRQQIRFNTDVLNSLQSIEEGQQALAGADAKGWNVTT